MSLGGMVAVDWARRHPDELAACVLVNTSLRPFSPWYRRLRPANYPALLGFLRPWLSDRQREQTILRITSRHPPPRRRRASANGSPCARRGRSAAPTRCGS